MKHKQMIREITSWLMEAAQIVREGNQRQLTVQQKTSRTDLVTNMDQEIQTFLIKKIHQQYPQDAVLAEEEDYSTLASLNGNVWIIDPIDGTMNFVFEKENFCIMLAYYCDGIGQLGFIFDVMKNELYWGERGHGVYRNTTKLPQPSDCCLADGLVGMNAYMYGENILASREIGQKSMAIRVSGCAGIELIAILKGTHIGYISNLSPWDYAAGLVLLTEFGIRYGGSQDQPLRFAGREYFFAATPTAYNELLILQENH